jgi:hypothetical protein
MVDLQTAGAAITVTVTGTPAFAQGFALALIGGTIRCDNITFSGSATGKRFIVSENGNIGLSLGDLSTYFPGNAPGEIDTGGVVHSSVRSACTGEEIKSTIDSASAVALTSGVAANITSVSLPPGKWLLDCVLNLNSGATGLTLVDTSVNSVSATLASNTTGLGNRTRDHLSSISMGNTGSWRGATDLITISSTTTYYFVASATFSGGTTSGFGTLRAIRMN